MLAIYALQFKRADRVTLAVYSENAKWLFNLAQAYHEIATTAGNDVEVAEFAALTLAESDAIAKDQKRELLGRAVTMRMVKKPREFFAARQSRAVGIALNVRGALAYPRFEPERGLHDFIEQKQHHRCLAHASEAALAEYKPPAGIERRGQIAHQEKRRTYAIDGAAMEDATLKETYYFQGERITDALRYAIEQRVIKAARALLES